MASDGKPPSTKMSVGKRIEGLACLGTVDVMLLEGTPVVDVAKFIQQDQGELTDVNEKTLANALGVRKLQRQEVDGYFGATAPKVDVEDLEDDFETDRPRAGGYRRQAQTPGTLRKKLTEGVKSNIQHMLELEALYLASRDRIDRWMELEAEVGAFSDRLGTEIVNAAKLLDQHFEVARELGLVETAGNSLRATLDVSVYSERTAAVLSKPESRHRVISLVGRLANHAIRTQGEPVKEPIDLPLPKVSDGDDE